MKNLKWPLIIPLLSSCLSFNYNATYKNSYNNGLITTYQNPRLNRDPKLFKNLAIGAAVATPTLIMGKVAPESPITTGLGIAYGFTIVSGFYILGHYTGNLGHQMPVNKSRLNKWVKSLKKPEIFYSYEKGRKGFSSISTVPKKYSPSNFDLTDARDLLVMAKLYPDNRFKYLENLGAKPVSSLDAYWLGSFTDKLPTGTGKLFFYENFREMSILEGELRQGQIISGTLRYQNRTIKGDWLRNQLHGPVRIDLNYGQVSRIKINYILGEPVGIGKGFNNLGEYIYDISIVNGEIVANYTKEHAEYLRKTNQRANIGKAFILGGLLSILFSRKGSNDECPPGECKFRGVCCRPGEALYKGLDGNYSYCDCQ